MKTREVPGASRDQQVEDVRLISAMIGIQMSYPVADLLSECFKRVIQLRKENKSFSLKDHAEIVAKWEDKWDKFDPTAKGEGEQLELIEEPKKEEPEKPKKRKVKHKYKVNTYCPRVKKEDWRYANSIKEALRMRTIGLNHAISSVIYEKDSLGVWLTYVKE